VPHSIDLTIVAFKTFSQLQGEARPSPCVPAEEWKQTNT
jgi:hypothetical protein